MNRTKQKQRKVGEQLLISHDAGKSFELVEGFFNNYREAEEYRDRHHPGKPWRIRGLRFRVGQVFTPVKDTEVAA